jgi:hypothetical protein
MNKADFVKEIYRLRLKYNPVKRAIMLKKFWGVFWATFWTTFLVSVLGGFGVLIWELSRPGLSISETLICEAVAYGLIIVLSVSCENGFGVIAVRVIK